MHVERIHDDRQGSGHALISAARYDHDRQLAAAHSGIRACRGLRACAHTHIVAARFKKCFAYRCAVVSAQPFLAYGKVIVYLPFEHIPNIVDANRFGEIENVVNIQHAAVGLAACRRVFVPVEQHLPVFLDEHNVRVIVAYAKAHTVGALVHVQVNVQQLSAFGFHDGHLTFVHELAYLRYLLGLYKRQDLKLLVRIAHDRSGCNGGCNALQAARIRNDNAFNVFDYVAAYDDVYLIRHCAEGLPCFCRGVGHCDRFCAAHCRQQLFTQDLQILRIFNIADFHFSSLRV